MLHSAAATSAFIGCVGPSQLRDAIKQANTASALARPTTVAKTIVRRTEKLDETLGELAAIKGPFSDIVRANNLDSALHGVRQAHKGLKRLPGKIEQALQTL